MPNHSFNEEILPDIHCNLPRLNLRPLPHILSLIIGEKRPKPPLCSLLSGSHRDDEVSIQPSLLQINNLNSISHSSLVLLSALSPASLLFSAQSQESQHYSCSEWPKTITFQILLWEIAPNAFEDVPETVGFA